MYRALNVVAFANDIHERSLTQTCQHKASYSELHVGSLEKAEDYFSHAATSLDDKKVTYYV